MKKYLPYILAVFRNNSNRVKYIKCCCRVLYSFIPIAFPINHEITNEYLLPLQSIRDIANNWVLSFAITWFTTNKYGLSFHKLA